MTESGRSFLALSLLILVVLPLFAPVELVGVAAAGNTAPTCSEVTYEGSGTSSSPYEVGTLAQLQCMTDSATATGTSDHFELTSDIDASSTSNWNDGDGFEPISRPTSGDNRFAGSLSGNGHTISSLYINRSDTFSGAGLFGYIAQGGEVERVVLEDVTITGNSPVGGLAANNAGNIQASAVSGSVTGDDTVGGLVGRNTGSITNSYATASVSVSNPIIGRLVNNPVTSNLVSFPIIGGIFSNPTTGGLVGKNGATNSPGTVTTSYAAGSVTGSFSGGLVGFGGNEDSAVIDSYWDTTGTGLERSAPGPDENGLTSTEMQGDTAESSMDGFDFNNVWAARTNGYPVLKYQLIPTLSTNAGLTVEEGSTANQITTGELSASDPDGDPLTYTVTSAVSHGTLFVDGSDSGTDDGTLDGESALRSGDTFTQSTIENGTLRYSHDGSETTSDSFTFDLSDGNDGSVAGNTFPISVTNTNRASVTKSTDFSVTNSNDPPTLSTNAGLTVEEGSTANQITTGELSASDPDGVTLTYTVTSAVSHGTLFVDGSGEGSDDGTLDGEPDLGTGTFSQSDLDSGDLLYSHDGSDTTSDSFTFDISDGNGESVTGNTFSISITPVNDGETNPCSPDTDSPTANAAVDDEAVQVGERVTFDGGNSQDACGIAAYEWDVDDDGSYEVSGRVPTHTFATAGVKPVTLRVTDAAGNTNTDEVTVTVAQAAEGTVSLTQTSYTEERGDIATIGVSLTNTDTATVTVGSVTDSDYATNVTVRDGNDDDSVTLRFNSFTAGTGAREQVVSVASPADAVVSWTGEDGDQTGASDPHAHVLGPGDYPLRAVGGSIPAARTEDGADATATLALGERSTNAVETWVASGHREDDIQDVSDIERLVNREYITEAATVATGDIVLARVDASGLEGVLAHRVDSGTPNQTAAFLGEQDRETRAWAFSINQTSTAAGTQPYDATLTHANADFIADESADVYWLVVDTTEVPEFAAGDDLQTQFATSDAFDLGPRADIAASADETLVTDDWSLVEPSTTVDTNADIDGDGRYDEVSVTAEYSQQITGTSTVAPGTVLTLEILGRDEPFVKTPQTVVQPNGTWTAVESFSGQDPGMDFRLDVYLGGREGDILNEVAVDGRIVEAPTASISFDDQESFGSEVTVDSVTLSDGGFVALHRDTDNGEVVGHSEYLNSGSHADVEITLDDSLTEDTTLVAMAHEDTDGDETYEFQLGSVLDGPYTDGSSSVTDSANIDVKRKPVRTTEDEEDDLKTTTEDEEDDLKTTTEILTSVLKMTAVEGPGFTIGFGFVMASLTLSLFLRRRWYDDGNRPDDD
jgi:hypothetical protein